MAQSRVMVQGYSGAEKQVVPMAIGAAGSYYGGPAGGAAGSKFGEQAESGSDAPRIDSKTEESAPMETGQPVDENQDIASRRMQHLDNVQTLQNAKQITEGNPDYAQYDQYLSEALKKAQQGQNQDQATSYNYGYGQGVT